MLTITEQLVQLLVVTDGELEMSWNDTLLLVVTGGVASQLENLGSEVLENGSEIDGSAWKSQIGSRMKRRDDSPAPTR